MAEEKGTPRRIEIKTGELRTIVLIYLFTDTAAILNSIVSNIYYGMLRGQISMYLLPKHLNKIQNGSRNGKKVYYYENAGQHIQIQKWQAIVAFLNSSGAMWTGPNING